jgi:signal transduction histidine kinase
MRTSTARKFKRLTPLVGRLVDAFPGGVAYLDASLVFRSCNDVQAGYFGRPAVGIVGRRLHDVARDNPDFCSAIERVAQTGEPSQRTALSVTWSDRPAEGAHHFIVSCVADVTRRGRVRGVFMAAMEATQTVASESETHKGLLERNKVLERIIHERDLLLGIISHEIRTPITTIFGNAQMLLRRLEDLDVDSRTRVISDIREEAERLNRLVENMLLLARAGAQAPVPTEPVPIDKSLGQLVLEHQNRFRERSFVISVKPRSLLANGQPDYMKQVIQNLLGNAEKYSPAAEQIDVRARRRGDEVIISILDRGPGIAPAESEIVFQPFYRSERTSTNVGGAGIGLAVCKLLVQAQSGRIWTRPRRGGGSVFEFTLPAAA